MNSKSFEQYMRTYETFGQFSLAKHAFIVIQLKLRDFDNIAAHYNGQYNFEFRNRMCVCATTIVHDYHGIYAETHKDEISILLPKDYTQFDRNQQTLLTLFASAASGVFTKLHIEPVQFIGTVFVLPTEDAVYDYFRWRQADATRDAMLMHAVTKYKRSRKISGSKAFNILNHKSYDELNTLLKHYDVNFNRDVPLWHRRGIAIYWLNYYKDGIDLKTGEVKPVMRRYTEIDVRLPSKDAYADFIYRRALSDQIEPTKTATKLS